MSQGCLREHRWNVIHVPGGICNEEPFIDAAGGHTTGIARTGAASGETEMARRGRTDDARGRKLGRTMGQRRAGEECVSCLARRQWIEHSSANLAIGVLAGWVDQMEWTCDFDDTG